MERFWIISNFNQDPSAVIKRLTAPYLICNQGDPRFVPDSYKDGNTFKQTKHTGHNISDYLQFIIENYNNLPENLGFAKGNLFPRHIDESTFISRQMLHGFVSLYGDEGTYHPTYHRFFPSLFISQQVAPGYYIERTNNWYVKHRKRGKHFPMLHDFSLHFFRRPPPRYIPFIPGACMIVPSGNIQRWPLDTYKRLYEAVTYDFFPVEAFHLERMMLYFFSFPQE